MSNYHPGDIAVFIAAPRELSVERFTQIVKHYLPKGSILLGIAKEEFVLGFEDQPQFRMLKQSTIQSIIDKVAVSASPHKIYTREYEQKDLEMVVGNLNSSQRVLLVNGSWKYAFHNHPAYKTLVDNNVPIKFISPFADEVEARAYEMSHTPVVEQPAVGQVFSEREMLEFADQASLQSFDYSFQTGVTLGRKKDDGYEFLLSAFNKVIPYQTYALHHGNQREKHLSKPHDTNHYDTIHAEMKLLVDAAKQNIDLTGSTLFINLLPCPNCARTLSQTDIAELVYIHDHSDGYAAEQFILSGKKVRRIEL